MKMLFVQPGKQLRCCFSKMWNIECITVCAGKCGRVRKAETGQGVSGQGCPWEGAERPRDAQRGRRWPAGTDSWLEQPHKASPSPFKENVCKSTSGKRHPPFSFLFFKVSRVWPQMPLSKPPPVTSCEAPLSAVWSLILKRCTWHFQKVKRNRMWPTKERIICFLQSEHGYKLDYYVF